MSVYVCGYMRACVCVRVCNKPLLIEVQQLFPFCFFLLLTAHLPLLSRCVQINNVSLVHKIRIIPFIYLIFFALSQLLALLAHRVACTWQRHRAVKTTFAFLLVADCEIDSSH